ncbi:redox-regulated ATPase YchF [Phyllobacterium salinisoli]|uniref:Ribosome-binding ATPase YchF n=1 Tax=Phyllobacterium salinisoli TaxID=1899321 RepID=A0A368K8K4_9HYPH|nr:redox-regulated ATPase YchF [Phyllobacterium salinisoli]RCS25554.1 redox-regulated ATPase YchF [Phyllobacterium salinisoli]
MGFKCGIVGLPNVGKSTLFNALTRTAAAQAANYPFCTIEPNTGEVAVPDPRMKAIAAVAKSQNIIPTRISFVDIAGLVRGASKGEGLGNQFLANIREVDAIVHVLRCFEDDDITHVEGRIDPVSDAETVETELMLSDLESIERRIVQIRKRATTAKDKEALAVLPLMEKALELLQAGKPVRILLKDIAPEDLPILQELNLLTSKPVLYVCNVAESDAVAGNEHTRAVAAMADAQGAESVVISAAIEAEVAQLSDEEGKEFLDAIGLEEPGLDRLIRAGYRLLDLITYFTAGPKETRAWTVKRGAKAPQAAGVIHTDFERGFIRAQTIAFDDYVTLGGEVAAKEAGKARDEGKEYVVQDGDVMLFRFNT